MPTIPDITSTPRNPITIHPLPAPRAKEVEHLRRPPYVNPTTLAHDLTYEFTPPKTTCAGAQKTCAPAEEICASAGANLRTCAAPPSLFRNSIRRPRRHMPLPHPQNRHPPLLQHLLQPR